MKPALHGMLARFETVDQLIGATRELQRHRFTRLEVYSPYPLHELHDLNPGGNPLPLLVLLGGLSGAAIAWGIQTYIAVYDYPLNVGGRPLYSWPAFVVVLFELTVLCAALAAFIGALYLSGFPRIHHTLFGVPTFTHATDTGFFLSIATQDALYRPEQARAILEQFDPIEVNDVAAL